MDVFKLMGRIAIDASDAIGEIDSFAKKVNNASKKITTSIGKISHAFTGTIKGLNQIGEVTERAGRRIAQGIAVGAAAVGTAAATIGKNALDIRSSIEQGLGGAEAVFKQYAYIVENNSKAAWKTAGLSMEEYLATANKMGSLLKGSGFSEADAAIKTQDLMQRAADVASIMGISIDAAMESIAGMAKGNFTMMDNLGVAMNDTTLEAYRLEKGMAKSVSTMTTAEKVGLAYEMFMERTADYAGNYAKENETAAGSLQTLKAAWSNFLGGVGTFDDLQNSAFGYLRIAAKTMGLDSLEPFILGAQKTVEEVAEILSMDNLDGRQKIAKVRRLLLEKSISLTSGMGEKIVQGVSSASGIISEALSDINVNLPHYLSVGRDIFNSVRDGVKTASAELVDTASIISPDLISGWFTMKTDFISIGLDILGGIADGINQDLAKGQKSTIATDVQNGVENVLNTIFSNAANTVDAMSGLGTLAINTIGAIATNITTNLEGEKGKELKKSFGEGIGNLLKTAAENIPSMLDAGKSIVTGLGDAVSSKKDEITAGIADVITSITDWLLDPANLLALGEAAVNIGSVIVDGTIQGLGQFGEKLITTIGDEGLKLVDGVFGTDFYNRSKEAEKIGLTGREQAELVLKGTIHGAKFTGYDPNVPMLEPIKEEAPAASEALNSVSASTEDLQAAMAAAQAEIAAMRDSLMKMPKEMQTKYILNIYQKHGIDTSGITPAVIPVTPRAKGAVFDGPTIFDTRLGRQMVGEAGPEAVAPIAVLQKYVQAAVKSANIERDSVMAELASAIQDLREGFNANMNLYVNKRHVASAMSRDMGRSIGNREYTMMKGMGG